MGLIIPEHQVRARQANTTIVTTGTQTHPLPRAPAADVCAGPSSTPMLSGILTRHRRGSQSSPGSLAAAPRPLHLMTKNDASEGVQRCALTKVQTLGEQDPALLPNGAGPSGAPRRRPTLTGEGTGRRAALSPLGRGDHASTLLGRPRRGLLPFQVQKGVFLANGSI